MASTKRIAATVCLVLMAIAMLWKINEALQSDASDRRRRRLVGEELRPPMYTFYAPLVRASNTTREQKTRKADQELLDVWKTAWYAAGWEPKVIGLEEAKRNPKYPAFVDRLRKVKLYGNGGRNQEYNEYCFLRFLAMAAVGGGTMADIDMFPLGKSTEALQNSSPDRFTVYQETLNKAGPVPSLCSGTGDEWNRIGESILDIAMWQPTEGGGWSDMMALMRLYKSQPNSMTLLDRVLGSSEFLKAPTLHAQCRLATQKHAWGVHFSHYDILQAGHRVFDRPLLVKEFAANWEKACIAEQN